MKNKKKLLRMLDANLNRSREGLRVLEDFFRFISETNTLRSKARKIRHAMEKLISEKSLIKTMFKERNSKSDLGKEVDLWEMKREEIFDLVYANFQRVKESTRVIEELLKIIDKRKVKLIKNIRYEIYNMEKKTFEKWTYLCGS